MGSSPPRRRPHALVIPYPAQGHVIPLMALSHRLVDHGFQVTFVNTHFNHARLLAASPTASDDGIRLVSIPDGLGPGEDRNDLPRLCDSILRVMPTSLEHLIRDLSTDGDSPVTCLVADQAMAWALTVAKKMGLRAAAFWASSAGLLATILSIPQLIERGIIFADGLPTSTEPFQLIPGTPPMAASSLAWTLIDDPAAKRTIFRYFIHNNGSTRDADLVLCNSFPELERPTLTHSPHIIPVGPFTTTHSRHLATFWPEDASALAWLDRHPPRSVVYVAFGSLTCFDPRQLRELALGLELSGRPFLWVVRPDLGGPGDIEYPEGFEERVGRTGQGKIVGWSTQREVLAHPSVGSFVSHCGWNSVMEGVSSGVPFLCWPYFLDQFLNRDYVCDQWKIGIRLCADEEGIISREEIRNKVGMVVADEGLRERAAEFKAAAERNAGEGGGSFDNFKSFVQAMKGEGIVP